MTISKARILTGLVWLALAPPAIASEGGSPPGGWHPKQGPLVLAEYHVWHGLPSHSEAFSGAFWLPHSRPYDSRDAAVVRRHVAWAQAVGIDGFVVDWYGPPDGGPKSEERAFMDQATQTLLDEAAARGFWIALLYDEGTVPPSEPSTAAYEERVISDLVYAESYFGSPAYLRLEEKPALFVFPYADVEPYLDWSRVRAGLSGPVTLIDRNPDPDDPQHYADFDGFYAWVQPSRAVWDSRGKDWGKKYLKWFYSTMRSRPYRDKITVGGVWPGFDDSLAPWGSRRFMSRRDGLVYERAWKMAEKARAPVVMIGTWNDFEEGTDIEYGARMVVDMELPVPEVLLRSSPLGVVWDPTRGEGALQVYRDGNLIYDEQHGPGVFFALESGIAYEVKLWIGGRPEPFAKAVKIRQQDPIAGVSPIVVD